MKTLKLKTIVIAAAIILFTGSSIFAQRGMRGMQGRGMNFNQNNMCVTALDLSDEQQTQIENLRLSHLKNMQTNRNEMNELRARKQTLMTSDNTNLNEVNSVIDKMTVLHNNMLKASAKHRKSVRTLLNDKQKIIFDSYNGRGMNNGRGYRKDRNHRNGNGLGSDYGTGYGNANRPGNGNRQGNNSRFN